MKRYNDLVHTYTILFLISSCFSVFGRAACTEGVLHESEAMSNHIGLAASELKTPGSLDRSVLPAGKDLQTLNDYYFTNAFQPVILLNTQVNHKRALYANTITSRQNDLGIAVPFQESSAIKLSEITLTATDKKHVEDGHITLLK